MNRYLPAWTSGAWMFCVVCVGFMAGCSSNKNQNPGNQAFASPLPVPSTELRSDQSWPVADYVRIGMPDPGRFWMGADYRNCRDILYGLDRTNRAALPRMESAKSSDIFARLVNPTNTSLLAERFLPSEERIRLFYAVLNRLPAFRDIYRRDSRELILTREVIELDHALLRMLGSAVTWDDKALPPSSGESRGATFHFVELSRAPLEDMQGLSLDRSVVPRGDRFITIGADTAVTLRSCLPWLADGTGMQDSDRLRAVRYLREDIPMLWRHISSDQQRQAVQDLEEILRRTRHEGVRQELEALRQQLVAN